MRILQKHSREIIAAILIFFVYCLTRLILLTDVPIFTDEAIYLRWAQIAGQDPNWRFISLTDGKGTLFIWLVIASMKLVSEPLIAGRLVSVIAGALTMLGLFFLAKALFKNRWIGIISAGLYAIFPFALVYDRLALYDSLVGTFAVWGLYVTVLFVRKVTIGYAIALGVLIGAAVLNKSNGFFTLYLLPFSTLLFDFQKKDREQRILKFIGMSLVVVLLTYAFYSILRLSPFFYLIAQKNVTFVHPLRDILMNPFGFIGSNFHGLSDWFLTYMKLPFSIAIIAAFLIDREFLKEKTLLLLWFILPFIALMFFGNTIYPRYLFFMVLSLLPLIAYTLYQSYFLIKNKFVFALLCVVIFALPLETSWRILTDFGHADVPPSKHSALDTIINSVVPGIPQSDVGQLYVDWPSGAGVKESVQFFRDQVVKHGHITIATEGTFGLLPYAYDIYFANDPHVTVIGMWPINDMMPPEKIVASSKKMPTYVVFYQPCIGCNGYKGVAPARWGLKQVLQVKKIVPKTYFTVYQVIN
ncbi:hypothetical protein BH11PAT1_BH11PAT1_4030 [soil metagenome]